MCTKAVEAAIDGARQGLGECRLADAGHSSMSRWQRESRQTVERRTTSGLPRKTAPRAASSCATFESRDTMACCCGILFNDSDDADTGGESSSVLSESRIRHVEQNAEKRPLSSAVPDDGLAVLDGEQLRPTGQ